MKRESYLWMVVNNTVRAQLYLLHPGDETLMIHDDYPYKPPTPVLISPESGYLNLKLKMFAKKKDWKIRHDFVGKKFKYKFAL